MTLEEIKKSIECHYDYKCEICPNNEELGSGEIVCISRLLPKIIDCINNLQSQLQQANEIINNPDTLIFQQQELIDNLQSQLAEKEKAIENWQTMYESVVQTCHNDKEEIERLNKRLTEKDKEIAYMTKQAKKFNNEAQKYYEDAYCNDFQKQTKISFAVEQLEKVLVLIHNAVNIDSPEYDLIGLYDAVSNQIKQLKGEK